MYSEGGVRVDHYSHEGIDRNLIGCEWPYVWMAGGQIVFPEALQQMS
jgi:hypothetical protein